MSKKRSGFILAEVLLAVLIMGTALASVAGMYIYASANVSTAAEITVATNLAQKQFELLKTKPASFWGASHGKLAWQDDSEIMPLKINNIEYFVETEVSEGAVPNLVQVKVLVSWFSKKTQQIELVSYFAK